MTARQHLELPGGGLKVARGEAPTGSIAAGATATFTVTFAPNIGSNPVLVASVLGDDLQVVSFQFRGGSDCGVTVRNIDSINAHAGTIMVVGVQA